MVSFIVLSPFLPDSAAASEEWSPVVIARGEYRSQIKAMPIEQRPNRPLHFYGNRVRRSAAVASPWAQSGDVRSPYSVGSPTYITPGFYSGGFIPSSGIFSRPQGVQRTRFLRY